MFETDDDDFMPSSSANLSAIFNATITPTDNANLSYKAPKQPKELSGNDTARNLESRTPSQLQSAVILAKVINLWKLENGENKLLGKHIVAVIGNENQRMYEVIIYKEKTNILVRQQVGEALILYKYPKNFIGIFDTHKQFWNLNFESAEDVESFLKEVSVHNCQVKEQNSHSNSSDQVDTKVTQSLKIENTNQLVNTPNANDTNSKDKILSRITKVGQQIFPKASIERSTSTELSDSESDSNYNDSEPPKPAIAPRKFRQLHDKALVAPVKTEKNISHPSYFSNDNQLVSNNNQMILNPQSMMYTQPYGVNNLIVAQNAELKASLAEINLKLATVLNTQTQNITVDRNGNNEECGVLKSKVKSLTLKIENLQSDLEKLNRRFEDLRKKYDQKCSEEGKNESWKKNLIEEINRLQKKLDEAEELRTVNIELSISIEEKSKLIEVQQQKLKDLEESYLHNQEVRTGLEKQISDMNVKIEQLTLQAKDYQEKLKYKEESSNETQKSDSILDKDVLNKKIKESMNEAFRCVMGQFDESEQYSYRDIQQVLLENLKKATYRLINTID